MIAKSTHGGNTWSLSFVAAPIPHPTLNLPNAQYRGGTNVTSMVDQRTGNVVVVFDDSSTGTLNEYAVHTLIPGDRCDPNDVLNCVTLSSSTDDGATWSSVRLLDEGFDGDTFGACLAFVQPPDCGNFFLGDYIAVASTDEQAQALWTGNGPHAPDVFSSRATFAVR